MLTSLPSLEERQSVIASQLKSMELENTAYQHSINQKHENLKQEEQKMKKQYLDSVQNLNVTISNFQQNYEILQRKYNDLQQKHETMIGNTTVALVEAMSRRIEELSNKIYSLEHRPPSIVHVTCPSSYSNSGYSSTRSSGNYDSGALSCFHGDGNCKMSDASLSHKKVKDLQVGDSIMTAQGTARKITHIMRSKTNANSKLSLCKINDLIITPLHPIQEDGEWIYPKDSKYLDSTATFDNVDYVYSIAIDSPTNEEYGIIIDNINCITLAHGITDHPILTHNYYGTRRVLDDYDEILRTMPNINHCKFNTEQGRIFGVV
jgi:hypothetical protein